MWINLKSFSLVCLERVDKSRVFWVKTTTNSNLKITNNIECIFSPLWSLMQQRGTYAWNNILATMLWNSHLACICHWWGNYGWKCNCGNNEILYVDTNPRQICQGSKEFKYHTGGDCLALAWFHNLRSLSLVYNLTVHTHTVEELTHALFPSRLLTHGQKSNDRVAKKVLYTTFNVI